jgi:hypothetical protein
MECFATSSGGKQQTLSVTMATFVMMAWCAGRPPFPPLSPALYQSGVLVGQGLLEESGPADRCAC